MSATLLRDAAMPDHDPESESELNKKKKGTREVAEPKESAFNDPRFWVSVTAVLLTLSIFIFGFIATQLISINAKIELASMANARQDERVKVLEDDNRELRNDVKALQKADTDQADRDSDYRFKMGNDLTEIKTRLGLGMKKE